MTTPRCFLFKRPNGVWYILYRDEGRIRWKSTKCKTRSEATKKLSAFEKIGKEKFLSTNLASFARDFLEYAESVNSTGTVEIFELALRHLQSIIGDCPLTSISFRQVDIFKSARVRAVSPVSVNIELRALRTILNTALRWNLIESNPFSKMQLLRIPETTPAFFTKEEFQKFIVGVKNKKLRDLFLIGAMTGMRRGELLNLKWSDLDFIAKTAHIQSSVNFNVKAGKRRIIPLSDQAMKILEQHRNCAKSEFVFENFGMRLTANYVSHIFKKYIRKAGLNEKLHLHSLRHTAATWMVQSRVSIYEVQKLLGHSDISTTQIYSHLMSSELHDAVNRIRIDLD